MMSAPGDAAPGASPSAPDPALTRPHPGPSLPTAPGLTFF